MTIDMIRDILRFPSPAERSVVAIGTFDGIHLGHQKVLATALAAARERNAASVALSFRPHPAEVLSPPGPGRLASDRLKFALMARSGIDEIAVLPFDEVVAAWTAEHFVRVVLRERLRACLVVVGFNFTFGRGGEGSAKTLQGLGRQFGFDVEVVEPVEVDGVAISSSTIRRQLGAGRVEEAARLLGRPYSLRGEVVIGRGRGKGLGFPTANVDLGDSSSMRPARGVYGGAVRLDGRRFEALVYFGRRPTFERDGVDTLEVHLVDWSGESLLGREITVVFETWLRRDESFSDEEALVRRMREDLSRVGPSDVSRSVR